jgi:hypothetical protein
MESNASETTTNAIVHDGTANNNHMRSVTDTSLSTVYESGVRIKLAPLYPTESGTPLPARYEVSRITSNLSFDSSQQRYHTMDLGPNERQLSILDPLSDRVSTILVWQNLTVSSRKNRHEEIFQKVKSCNKYVPKRKCLLNNLSGAITGGLWAIMGKLSVFFLRAGYIMYSVKLQVHPVLESQLY